MIIRISHRIYKAYYLYVLQSLYWYFLSYTYSELTLVVDLFLFRSPVGHIFILISRRTYTFIDFLVCDTELIHILILISHRTHTYSDSSYTVLNLYIYLDEGTYHVLILLFILNLFRSLVGVTELMLIPRYLYTYWYLYLSQISRRSLKNLCLYRGTLRYYKAYTYTIGLILILRRLHLFGGTRRYYRTDTCTSYLTLVL